MGIIHIILIAGFLFLGFLGSEAFLSEMNESHKKKKEILKKNEPSDETTKKSVNK